MVFLFSFSFFFLQCWLTAHRRVCYSLRRETCALELESARYGRLNELYRAGVTITRACGHGSRLQSQQEKTVGAKEYFSCISFLFPLWNAQWKGVCVFRSIHVAYKKGATRMSPFHHKAPRTESTSWETRELDHPTHPSPFTSSPDSPLLCF